MVMDDDEINKALTGFINDKVLEGEGADLDDDTPLLDLEYTEDSAAQVDMNVIVTGSGRLVEVQGTGERRGFSRGELDALLDLAFKGTDELAQLQQEAVAEVLANVEELQSRGRHRAEPKDPSSLWGRPE